jgi:hypothetical protein
LGSSFTSRFGTPYGVTRCEEGADRADPEEEEFEYVLLECQRAEARGDGGGEGGISNLRALLWMPSTTADRVCPKMPQKQTHPSLFHVFLRPTRPSVLFMSTSYCTWKKSAH